MHGHARLRLVGTPPLDGMEECPTDDFPQPLPFPSCVRDLPRRASGRGAAAGRGSAAGRSAAGQDALDALDRMSLAFARLRDAATDGRDGDGPRAA